ncbi:MAG: acyltransferase [Anaerolineales bacterium]|nr:acyltransferase [Anaerolineales bacterium]
MTETKQKLQEFEALRGLSILLLLALHSEVFDSSIFGFEVDPLAQVVASFLLGSFFFLAGFFAEFSRKKGGANSFSFLKSKFIRIFPPYWIALALFVFVIGFSLKRFDALMYALNLQWLLSPVFIKRLLTLWYISVLVGYYLVFGILLFRVKSNLGLLVWSVVLFAMGYTASLATGLFEPRFFQYYFVFLAGIYFYRFEKERNILFGMKFLYTAGIALVVLVVFWKVASAGLNVPNLFFIFVVDLFILGWVLMWLSIFRTRAGSWKIWAFLSTASFFTYLYHRPLWHVLDTALGLEAGTARVFFNLIPGGMLALILGYFLQVGYDRLLVALHLKG